MQTVRGEQQKAAHAEELAHEMEVLAAKGEAKTKRQEAQKERKVEAQASAVIAEARAAEQKATHDSAVFRKATAASKDAAFLAREKGGL